MADEGSVNLLKILIHGPWKAPNHIINPVLRRKLRKLLRRVYRRGSAEVPPILRPERHLRDMIAAIGIGFVRHGGNSPMGPATDHARTPTMFTNTKALVYPCKNPHNATV